MLIIIKIDSRVLYSFGMFFWFFLKDEKEKKINSYKKNYNFYEDLFVLINKILIYVLYW